MSSAEVFATAARACVQHLSDSDERRARVKRADQSSETPASSPHLRPLPAARAGGGEYGALFGTGEERPSRLIASGYFPAVRSNCRSITLPRATAASSASLAVFLPANACSISSAQTSRNCTMLPRRRPREFSVGSLLVSSSSGVSR